MSVFWSVQDKQRECNIKCGIFKKEVSGLNMAEIKNSESDMSTQQKAELDKEKRREERGKKSKKTALQGTE